jgi:hypothetical protein
MARTSSIDASATGTCSQLTAAKIDVPVLLMRRAHRFEPANFALSGQLAWTPGGYGVVFGRTLQDGIITRHLRDHCPQAKLKLCPYRDRLPATADEFLWGKSMFNTLGRGWGPDSLRASGPDNRRCPIAAGDSRSTAPARSTSGGL